MRKIKLTEGNIYRSIFALSMPIMLTSFITMSYNLMDMFWLGRLSTEAVSAVGTIGLFGWLANSVVMAPRIGVEISVAQSIGRNDHQSLRDYISSGIKSDLFISLVFMAILYGLREPLISFYHLGDIVTKLALDYLKIYALAMPFTFFNPVMSGIYNGSGDSKTPFIINTIGLMVNMILDPLLIFGYFGLPEMGIKGAAWATLIAQGIVSGLFVISGKEYISYCKEKVSKNYLSKIYRLGIPAAGQSCLFAIFTMVMTRFVANFGQEAVAAQKVGNQIESITWMSATGFSTALSTFVAQNYGAKQWDRVMKGYFIGMRIIVAIGLFTSFLLYFGGESLLSIFLPGDIKGIAIGTEYLKILALSEIFMSAEIVTNGSFNGLGKTSIPSVNGIIFNFLRIPVAYFIVKHNFGLVYIWWDITILSILKGISVTLIFYFYYKKYIKKHIENTI
ncbi:MAG: MATE family efflux transporter [Tissierellia bacterium]|nr:MATE family efflux transporter [Tissierellia bacterium]